MLQRKIIHKLRAWRERSGHKPLVLRGARQVGKSTVVRQFGKEYTIFIELNLEKQADKLFFETEEDVKRILTAIAFSQEKRIVPGKTLLFIDEIQEMPKAIQWLRYFYEDQTDVDVIAAGSLLEFALRKVQSFPVGRVEQIAMHPLSFEEFINAHEDDLAIEYYHKIPFDNIAYSKLLEYYHRYLIIGGMPEVVSQYLANGKSMLKLGPLYESIWQGYVEDVEKYAKNSNESKVLKHIMNTAPYQRDRVTLSKFGESNYRSREVGEAFQSLEDARIIRLIRPTSDIKPPLTPHLKRKPRLQILDTGLMNYASQLQAEMILLNDFTDFYKGFVVIHSITQELIASSNSLRYQPYFWTKENAKSNAEVDIVFQHGQLIIPIEVKSGSQGRLRSLHEFMDQADHTIAIRFLANEFYVQEAVTTNGKPYTLYNMPYFLAGKLLETLDWIKLTLG